MRKLFALALLGLFLIRHFFLKYSRRLTSIFSKKKSDTVGKYIAALEKDDLKPISKEDAFDFSEMQRCIRCGLCDMLCVHTNALMHVHFYQGPSMIASTHSRNLADNRYTTAYIEQYEQCGECKRCIEVCPTNVPIKRIVQSMQKMADNQETRQE